MEYKQFENKYLLRLDKGEEVVSVLKDFCAQKNILCGAVAGIGAVDKVTLGVFYPATKEYKERTLEGIFEITSLLGNVSTKDKKAYLHLHINVGDTENKVFGGHLVAARISATGEIFVNAVDGTVERSLNDEIGLNLLDFEK